MNAKNPDRINARCLNLEAMGFIIHHQDSDVRHPSAPGVVFDFSATAEEKFVTAALKIVMDQARREGANNVRRQFSELLQISE